jgi:hypothetical protein
MYDQRIQLSYSLSTQAQSYYDDVAVYKTSTQKVKVEKMKSVTVWREEPVYATQVQLVTEVAYDQVTGRSSFGSADSVSAGSISIQSGGSVNLSGKMTATHTLGINALGQVSLQGNNKPGSNGAINPIAATLSANTIDVYAGTTLLVADSGVLKASQSGAQSAATLALHAGNRQCGGRFWCGHAQGRPQRRAQRHGRCGQHHGARRSGRLQRRRHQGRQRHPPDGQHGQFGADCRPVRWPHHLGQQQLAGQRQRGAH